MFHGAVRCDFFSVILRCGAVRCGAMWCVFLFCGAGRCGFPPPRILRGDVVRCGCARGKIVRWHRTAPLEKKRTVKSLENNALSINRLLYSLLFVTVEPQSPLQSSLLFLSEFSMRSAGKSKDSGNAAQKAPRTSFCDTLRIHRPQPLQHRNTIAIMTSYRAHVGLKRIVTIIS